MHRSQRRKIQGRGKGKLLSLEAGMNLASSETSVAGADGTKARAEVDEKSHHRGLQITSLESGSQKSNPAGLYLELMPLILVREG